MDLRRVRRNCPEVFRHIGPDIDRFRKRFGGDLLHFLDKMLHLDVHAFAFDAACERENLLDHVGPSFGARLERVEYPLTVGAWKFSPQDVHRHHDRAQHIIEVVRDPAGKRSDALHPLRAEHLLFDSLFVRDVARDDEDVPDAAALIPNDASLRFNEANGSVFQQEPERPNHSLH